MGGWVEEGKGWRHLRCPRLLWLHLLVLNKEEEEVERRRRRHCCVCVPRRFGGGGEEVERRRAEGQGRVMQILAAQTHPAHSPRPAADPTHSPPSPHAHPPRDNSPAAGRHITRMARSRSPSPSPEAGGGGGGGGKGRRSPSPLARHEKRDRGEEEEDGGRRRRRRYVRAGQEEEGHGTVSSALWMCVCTIRLLFPC